MSFYITGEKNITFLHIPKTAGTSILDWLRTNKGNSDFIEWETHPKLSTILENKQPNFTFTVVRNPWDRMVSLYSYLKSVAFVEGSAWIELNNITLENFPTFSHWLVHLETYQTSPNLWFNGLSNQVEWMDGHIDLIIRYEELDKEFVKVQELVDCNKPLPKFYVSTREQDYRTYYTDTTRKLVATIFEEDIDTLKYYF